jgi:hypothetical protein
MKPLTGYYRKELIRVRELQVNIRHEAIDAIDDMALAIPDGFVWPNQMRKAYEQAIRILSPKIKAWPAAVALKEPKK